MMEPELAAGRANVTVTHEFDAPRDLVWTVWTDPAHAKHWWGPAGFTTPVYEADLRPGGKLVRHMRAADGMIVTSEGTYEVVDAPERLVSVGWIERPGEPPFGIRTSVVFEELDGRTTVTVHQAYENLPADAAAGAVDGARAGWTQSAERLATYLRSLADAKR